MNLPKLQSLFIFHHQQQTQVALHKHNCYELVYFYRGRITSRIDGVAHEIAESSFIIYPPYVEHDEYHVTNTKCLCATFFCSEQPVRIPFCVLKDKDNSISQLLDLLVIEHLKQEKFCDEAISNILNLILLECARIAGGYDEKNEILNVIRYINLHFTEDIDLKDLADLSGYSYDRFRHKFKEVSGQSPLDYIVGKKIDYSKTMLANSNMPVAMIAINCGFDNISRFSVVFKQYTGFTPSQYRAAAAKVFPPL